MRNTIAFLISLIIALFIPAGSAFSQRQADAEASVSGISAGSSEGTENSAVGRFFSKKPKGSVIAVPGGGKKDWTILIYLLGDNNLEYSSIMDFLELEQGITGDKNIIVLWDRPKNGINLYDNSGHAKLYRIKKSNYGDYNKKLPSQLASEVLKDYGEINMSDPDVLENFLTEAIKTAPADRYAFIPWDHGLGMLGLLSDDDPGASGARKGLMTLKQFSKAVQNAAAVLPRRKFDLIIYNMCLMGQLDVMSETWKFADFAIASPPSLPMIGLNFKQSLQLFNRETSTRQTAIELVNSGIRSLERESFLNAALSAYDLSVMPEITASLKNLSDELGVISDSRSAELTKTLAFASHLQNLNDDLDNLDRSSWSIRLDDWMHKLKKEIPDINQDNIRITENLLNRLVIATGATPGAEDAQGIGLYLPYVRKAMNSLYDELEFGKQSGVKDFLMRLYDNQKKLKIPRPRIDNIEIGTIKVKEGRTGLSNDDFILTVSDRITPLRRNVMRFNISGRGILLSKIFQTEIRNGKRFINYFQIVTNNRIERQKAQEESSGFFSSISPDYKDGDNLMMFEIPGVKYRISCNHKLYDATVNNVSLSSKTYENLSTVDGLYTDSTLNGRELKVRLEFFNTTKTLYKVTALGDTSGRSFTGQVVLRSGGILKLANYVVDQNRKITVEYGEPIHLKKDSTMDLLLDLLENDTVIQNGIIAKTLALDNYSEFSAPVKVVRNQEQDRLLENTYRNWGGGTAGKYAMVQFTTSGNETMVVPNFRILSLKSVKKRNAWFLNDSNDQEIAHGNFNIFVEGVPEIILHLPEKNDYSTGQTVESWYAFLSGTGENRVWYLVGEGDGVRSMLVPLEQYKPEVLDGLWRSDTELWKFDHGRVEYMRIKEKLVAKGTYTVHNDLIKMNNMPFDEYAFYYDRAHRQLTLVPREQKRVSVLKKVSDTVTDVTVKKDNSSDNSKKAADNKAAAGIGSFIAGNWLSGTDTGNAKMTIASYPGTPYFSMQLLSRGQGMTICTFSVNGSQLDATFPDGTREKIGIYMADENTLTLYFPNMPPISFKRQY